MDNYIKETYNNICQDVNISNYLDLEQLTQPGCNTDSFILVFMIDYYNSLIYKEMFAELTDKDLEFLNMADHESLDSLITLVRSDYYYIKEAIEFYLSFKNLSNLQQQDVMRFIRRSIKDNLITRTELYKKYIQKYIPSAELKEIIADYKDQIDIYGKSGYVRNDAVNNILVNFKELKTSNMKGYQEIMQEIIPEYYKYCKSPNLYYKKTIRRLLYLFVIKNSSKDDVIKFCSNNENFEAEVLKLYLYIQSLSPDLLKLVSDSGEKRLSKTIKRKYNIKEN